jgi:integrase
MPLKDVEIKNAKLAARTVKLFDGGGLFLEVLPSGRKTFRIDYRYLGKGRTLSVGQYPDTKLADARIEVGRVKAALRRGEDRVESAPLQRPEAPAPEVDETRLWRNVAARYLEFRRRDGAAHRTMAKLETHVAYTFGVLGEKVVDQVSATDILAVVRPIEATGRTETAHRVRAVCSQIFEFAEAEGIPNSNPARVSRGAMVRRAGGSHAGVTDPKLIGRLMRAIRAYRGEPQVRVALLLSAYLFPRNTELRAMRRDEIDRDKALWNVPGARMKMGHDHVVPLSTQTLALLREIRLWTRRSELVIPAPRDPGKMVSDMTFNAALRWLGFSKEVHVHHGFRVSASTTLNELGFNRCWIERQLAHVTGNKVRGT